MEDRNKKEKAAPKSKVKRKSGPGTPSKMTPERVAIILEGLAAGLSYTSVSALAGISHYTLINWRGSDEEFRLKCEAAISSFEMQLVQVVQNAAIRNQDWRAAFAILERRFRRDWGKEAPVEKQEEQVIQLEWFKDS